MAPLNDRKPAQQLLFPDVQAPKRRVRLRLPRRPQLRARRAPLWLAVDLPGLPLLVFLRGQEIKGPHAVIETRGTSSSIVAVNSIAAERGVEAGMTLAAAWSMAAELEIHQRDKQREEQLLQRLAWWANRYTPQVAIEPEGLLLEIRGCLRLFGGVAAMKQAVRQGFRELGIPVCLAMAPTPRAARWLVRAAHGSGGDHPDCVEQFEGLAGSLGEIPLRYTDFSASLCERLAGMGLRKVADVQRLPRDGFARRCGPQALEMLDQALGRIPDIRDTVSLPPRFCSKLELLYDITDTAVLLHPAAHLLQELEAWLRATQQGVRRLQFDIILQSGETQSLRLGFLDALRDIARMRALLEQQLERVTLPEPARALRLEAVELEGFAGRAQQLFSEDRKGAGAAELVELLRARLGHEAVTSLEPLADYRPEASWSRMEPGKSAAPGADLPQARRPAWLLPQPRRLAVRRVREQDCPVYEGELHLLDGPERIESGWWDGADIARDYYRARNAAGMELWIFRDRRSGEWWLHGFFS